MQRQYCIKEKTKKKTEIMENVRGEKTIITRRQRDNENKTERIDRHRDR